MGGGWNFIHEIGVVKKDTNVPLGLSSHKGEKQSCQYPNFVVIL